MNMTYDSYYREHKPWSVSIRTQTKVRVDKNTGKKLSLHEFNY